MADLRPGFREIVEGWTLVADFGAITERLEQAAAWTTANGPLLPDEHATIQLMIEAQLAHGDPFLYALLRPDAQPPRESSEERE